MSGGGQHAGALLFFMTHAKPFSFFFSHVLGFILLFAGVFVFPPGAGAQDEENKGQNVFEKHGIKPVAGPAVVNLGRYAEIDLPGDFLFIGEPYLKKYYELTHNSYSGNEIGVVISRGGWEVFFKYVDSGHIDDSDRAELDADALYKQMEKNQGAGNLERKKRGWDELRLKGWTAKPHYDEKTNNLTWAFRMASSSDNYAETFSPGRLNGGRSLPRFGRRFWLIA